ACGSDDGGGSSGGPGGTVVPPPDQGQPLQLFPEDVSDAEVQIPYLVTLTASGGFKPYTFSALSGMPPGMAVNAAGSFGGVPTQAGDYNVTLRVRDVQDNTTTRTYSIRVVPAGALPTISTPSIPTATFGGAYAVQLAVNGGTPPFTFSDDGGFPMNIALSSDGYLSGVAQEVGAFPVTLTVEDALGSRTMRSLTFEVTPTQSGPQILTTQPAPALLGMPYAFQFQATGGNPPYQWSSPDPLPAGLMLSSDGVLSGTSSQIGNHSFLLVVTDATSVLTGVLVTLTTN
ncbi:MAG: putative Ig domain-containing protein, partial [Planctomycetes bacterium]|nr:putative Ig domain-containing protein [Planctomycetota bacterium]